MCACVVFSLYHRKVHEVSIELDQISFAYAYIYTYIHPHPHIYIYNTFGYNQQVPIKFENILSEEGSMVAIM